MLRNCASGLASRSDPLPVYRFRTLDEARRALWLKPDDPRLPDVIRFVWTLADELTFYYPRPPGVRKFRSIEEANAAREAWETERVRWLQARHSEKQQQVNFP